MEKTVGGQREGGRVKVVMLDIEGTVCPISFVKDELFPYFLRALPEVLSSSWDDESLRPYIAAFPSPFNQSAPSLLTHSRDLTARDIKDPALKALQGHVWKAGYDSGAIKCPLFPDVAPAMAEWRSAGIPIVIYSSGSIAAQKLLFGHTTEQRNGGDLNPEIAAYFDTVTAGSKTAKESYGRIFETFGAGVGRAEWLFLSDNVKEVEAAIEAGMVAKVVVRKGNPPLSEDDLEKYSIVSGFEELEV